MVTDHCLKGETGLDILRWISQHGIDVPVLVISGQGDELLATETLKLGAYDYIAKSEESLAALPVSLEHALHRHELEQRAQRLQQIVENASGRHLHDGPLRAHPDGQPVGGIHVRLRAQRP